MKKSILIYILFTTLIYSQGKGTLSGFIYDASNGEALIGANIYLKVINLGAASNGSGYFAIPNIPEGSHELIASYIGYKTFQTKITIKNGEEKRLDIKLEPGAVISREVVVSADSVGMPERLFNKPVSKIDLSPVQLGKVPQVVEADLLRTLQSMPGIVPVSDFSSAIYVRGGTPDQNLFLIDGTDVYNPEHAFGLFSTFNTDAIKKVEVYKGGFGAEYGGRLSAVINVINNDGNRNNFEGKATLSLLTLNTTLQTPIGKIGSLSGSVRRTYLDQTLAKVIDDIPDYYFLDGNIKAFFDINNKNKLSVSFYGGIDDLDFKLDKDRPQSFGFKYVWGNQTGSINWRTIFSPKLFGNFWITASRFFSDFNIDIVEFSEANRIEDFTIKGAVDYFYSKEFTFKFGFEQKNINGALKQEFTSARIDVSKHRTLYSLYFSAQWAPNPLWDIEAGLRYDYFVSDKNFSNLDPRLTVKYRLTEKSNLKFSTGIFHQYANRIPRLFFVSIWVSADDYINGSSSNHYILSYQRILSKNIEFEVEGYYKTYNNIYSFNPNYRAEVEPQGYTKDNLPVFASTKGLFNRGDGYSRGLEILLRKDAGALTGWLAYSCAQTEYLIDNVNKNNYFKPRHDRTHAINFVLNADLSNLLNELYGRKFANSDKQWSLGLNFTYFSGQPITLPASVYIANSVPDWDITKNSLQLYPSDINEFRLPYYARLDFSLNYKITYDGWSLSPYLQVFNLLNRKNVWFIQYENEIENNTAKLKVKNVTMFPILPSVGITIKF
ncbi:MULTISPECIES: TonB-dependent receptor [Melioribacter]|nr:TonB-dependent receptor [Melioribacter roseus]